MIVSFRNAPLPMSIMSHLVILQTDLFSVTKCNLTPNSGFNSRILVSHQGFPFGYSSSDLPLFHSSLAPSSVISNRMASS